MRRGVTACFLLFLVALGVCAPSVATADQIEVKRKRLSIFAPDTERATAERIAEQGEAALDRYAADLGIKVPPETRFKIFLDETAGDYEKAEEPRTHGLFKTNLAFTYKTDGEVHMVLQPRPGRGPAGDAPGMLEALAMHELSHALQYKAKEAGNYDLQPDWLSEGMAELCAERAVGKSDRGIADKTPWFGDFILDAREALDLGTFIPLERLIEEGLQGKNGDVHDRQIRYGESWALVRLLDSPDDPARRQRFRRYLQDVMAMTGDDVGKRANEEFRTAFGKPTKGGKSLVELERELVKSIRDAKVFPWQIIWRDLRAAPDGTLIVESFPEQPALSVSTAPSVGPRAKIKATVTIDPGGGQQADIIFSYKSPEDYYKLAFGASGFITVMRFDGAWKDIGNVGSDKLPAGLLAVGVPHEIEISVDVGRIYAAVDGTVYLRSALVDKSFGTGRFGIGCYDGRVTFKNVSMAPF